MTVLFRWNVSLLLAVALHASADSILLKFDAGGRTPPPPWSVKVKKGHADVKVRTVAERHAICLASDKASFSIQRKADVDTRRTPRLHWSWLAEQLPPNGDLRDPKRDDQAAQLFVAFSNGRAISYVWDSNAPKGTRASTYIPLFVDIRILVIESGAANAGAWVPFTRNVRDDYRALFGGAAPNRIAGVRFQINSQHTRATARSCLAELNFSE